MEIKQSFIQSVVALMLVVTLMITMIPLQNQEIFAAETKEIIIPPLDYSHNGQGLMCYKYMGSGGYLFQGYFDGEWIKSGDTTTDLHSGAFSNHLISDYGMTSSNGIADFIDGGNGIKVTFYVSDTNYTEGKLTVGADIMIGDNDNSVIEVLKDDSNQPIGFKMTDDITGRSFNLYYAGHPEITTPAVYGYWMGEQKDNHINLYQFHEVWKSKNGAYEQDEQGNYVKYSGADSAIRFTWDLSQISGKTKICSYVITVDSSNVIPKEPPVWHPDTPITFTSTEAPLKLQTTGSVKDSSGTMDTLYYSIDGGEWKEFSEVDATGIYEEGTGTIDLSGRKDGTYRLRFKAVNDIGLSTEVIERILVIDDNGVITYGISDSKKTYKSITGDITGTLTGDVIEAEILEIGGKTNHVSVICEEDGSYNYCVLMEQGDYDLITKVKDNTGNIDVEKTEFIAHHEDLSENLRLPARNQNSIIDNSKAGEFSSIVNGLDRLAFAYTGGDEATYKLAVEKLEENHAEAVEIKNQLERDIPEEDAFLDFIDYSLQEVNSSGEREIEEFVDIYLPYDTSLKEILKVYRNVNGIVEEIPSLEKNPNSEEYYGTSDNIVKMHVRKFGTYGIGYLYKKPIIEGVLGKNNWYVSDVRVVAPEGCQISLDGVSWTSALVYNQDDEYVIPYYLKSDMGYMAPLRELSFKRDATAPEVSIQIDEKHRWTTLLDRITFEIFYNQNRNAVIAATDVLSGVETRAGMLEGGIVRYYISPNKIEDVTKITDWIEGDTVLLLPSNQYIVYAKAEDNAGNVRYICSNGVVIDDQPPVIEVIEQVEGRYNKENDIHYGDLKIKVTDSYLKEVNENGRVLTADKDGFYNIPADNQMHKITARDLAGNEIILEIWVMEIHQITFRAEGDIVDIKEVWHGTYLAEELPTIPRREGYDQTAPYWERTEFNNITEDITVDAVYTINVYEILLPQNSVGFELLYTDSLAVNNSGSVKVVHGDDFIFQLVEMPGYSRTEQFQITSNNVGLEEGKGYFTIADITCNQVVEVVGIADITPPKAKISMEENQWNSRLNDITFGLFFRKTQNVVIQAEDEGSGVDKVYYYVAEKPVENLLEITEWKEGNTFAIDPNREYIIYMKAIDKAGNIGYINSDGVVLDSINPVINGIENGGNYSGSITFTVEDKYLDSFTVDGETADVSADGTYTIMGDGKEHTIRAVDKAGNTTEYVISVQPSKNAGKIYDTTDPSQNALQAAIEGKDIGKKIELNETELQKLQEGYDILVSLETKDITKDITEIEKSLIGSKLQENAEVIYLEMKLYKQIEDTSEKVKIPRTTEEIEVTLVVPEEIYNREIVGGYQIVRLWEGMVTLMDGVYHEENHTITFKTDRFSTYGLAYVEAATMEESETLESERPESEKPESESQETEDVPKMGDSYEAIGLWGSIMALGFLLVSMTVYRKKE